MVIGGWSAYEAAHRLTWPREYDAFNIPIICVPAAIDNNLPGSELSIGADTALNSIVEVVDKIKQSSLRFRRDGCGDGCLRWFSLHARGAPPPEFLNNNTATNVPPKITRGEHQRVQRLGSGRHAELIGGRVVRLAARGGEDCGEDGVEPLGNDSIEVRGQSKPTFVRREVEAPGLAVGVVGHADEVEAQGMHHSTVMADAEVTNGRQRDDGERPGP